MNMFTRIANKILKTHEKRAEAESLKQNIVKVTLESSQKIDKMNSTLRKTNTYYIGRAMGIVK